MSFSRISQIINRFEGVNSDEKVPVSKETKALKLFSEGKDPVSVAIELDMKIDEIKRLYLEYLNMKGLDDLTKFYYEQGDQFRPLVQFYNNLRSKGISPLKVIELAELVNEISQIENSLRRNQTEYKECYCGSKVSLKKYTDFKTLRLRYGSLLIGLILCPTINN